MTTVYKAITEFDMALERIVFASERLAWDAIIKAHYTYMHPDAFQEYVESNLYTVEPYLLVKE